MTTDTRPTERHPARSSAASLLERHPVLIFFALSYAVSWALWTPLVILRGDVPEMLGLGLLALGSLVPSAVAILLVAVLQGRCGVRELLSRLLLWRVGWRWYVVVLAGLLLVPCAFGVRVLFGGSFPTLGMSVPLVLLTLGLSIFPGSAVGEEIGWRGFVLPRLQARHSALGAGLVLGVGWGMWHLPLWLTGTASHTLGLFPAFVVSTVALSILYTWIYNGTRGSLLIVVLFHAATNLALSVYPDALVDGAIPAFLIFVALVIVTAAVVAAACGPANLSRRHRRLEI
jgi:uncharacterized protein